MSSIITKLLGGVFLAGAIAGAPSCADTDSAIFIRQVQLSSAQNDCTVSNDPTSPFYSRGVMDVRLTSSYRAWMLIGNQLIPRGNNATLRPETSRVHFYEAEVILFDFGGAELAAYTQPLTGFADPTNNTAPGYGLADLLVIDPSTAGSLPAGQTIVARIKVFGRTLGGIEVETDYWDYPIEICDGCLIGTMCQLADDCNADCLFVCDYGQDFGVDCRATGMVNCPADAPTCMQPTG